MRLYLEISAACDVDANIHLLGSFKKVNTFNFATDICMLYLAADFFSRRRQTGPKRTNFGKKTTPQNHILKIRLLIGKANDYHLDLNLAFVDYKKAFDSV